MLVSVSSPEIDQFEENLRDLRRALMINHLRPARRSRYDTKGLVEEAVGAAGAVSAAGSSEGAEKLSNRSATFNR
jgi:hypothetical protein